MSEARPDDWITSQIPCALHDDWLHPKEFIFCEGHIWMELQNLDSKNLEDNSKV